MTTALWPHSHDFWRGKRVLVTGGAGFLGRFVVDELRDRGAQDISIPRSAEFDLTQISHITKLLADTRPHLIIHLAARVGGIGANREHPADFFYDNLMMGVQLLHEAWRTGVQKFVAIGTVCAYPKHAPIPFREEDLWNGYPEETNASYGLAKKMLLVQSQAYREQYGFNSIFLLPVNLYGPGDNFDPATSHVIPALIRKCEEARQLGDDVIDVWSDGSPTREFLYAPDAAHAIVLAAERFSGPEPVNLGSATEISIRDLVHTIANLTGFHGEIRWDTSKPNGQPRRKLDVSRAEQFFGFRATTSFKGGLLRTVDWYRSHPQNHPIVLPIPLPPGAAEREYSTIPPVEDLFDVTLDEIDFMSAQSFPASDPPPSPSAIAPRRVQIYSKPSDKPKK